MGTHNEAKSSHPELLLSFHVEDDTQKNEPDDKSPENITKIVPPTTSIHSGQRHPNLVPRLCSEEGLIQIGPEDECSDTFSLSILIGTANNLEMVQYIFFMLTAFVGLKRGRTVGLRDGKLGICLRVS